MFDADVTGRSTTRFPTTATFRVSTTRATSWTTTSTRRKNPNAASTYPCGGLPDEHPRYSSAKEKSFFDVPERVSRGLSHYAASFPSCDPARPTFDGSPDYLALPNALDAFVELYGPERIARSTTSRRRGSCCNVRPRTSFRIVTLASSSSAIRAFVFMQVPIACG